MPRVKLIRGTGVGWTEKQSLLNILDALELLIKAHSD